MKSVASTALVTPSYSGDFEHCRLLCDSVDQFVAGRPDHYILVDNGDYAQFLSLAAPNRHIVNELDILPGWLKNVRQGFSASSRKIWYSNRTWPMRGWHVQQLRRIAIASHLSQDGILYCDSDMLFVKPFDAASLWQGNQLRLYRNDKGIGDQLPGGWALHRAWTQHAANLNGLQKVQFPAHDYINNMVSWRRDLVIEMCAHIENVTAKHWLAAIGSKRSFSECQIYGAFADGIKDGVGHYLGKGGLCQTYWSGEALTRRSLDQFLETMEPDQVAIGIQSFTGTSPDLLRDLIAA
ncbi:MAG: hypothetical protein GKR97_13680 [Rhizobiaceae bacterium]|nr:hypothetical protein [Rhizobiaceae bacterium]